MKYLTPEIAALSKVKPSKSLFKRTVSCGIFQDIGEEESLDPKFISQPNMFLDRIR